MADTKSDKPAADVSVGSLDHEDGTAFAVALPNMPEAVTPIIDPDTGLLIGYRGRGSVWNIYDIEGNWVSMGETGLERPLFDPIDLIGGFGGKAVFRLIARAATSRAARYAAVGLSTELVATLRVCLAKFTGRGALKFTATTAAHMAERGRFVPVHILQLAVKYGKRVPDPDGVKGAFLYTIKMWRQVPGEKLALPFKEYTLEVVLRESDNMILHFLYKP